VCVCVCFTDHDSLNTMHGIPIEDRGDRGCDRGDRDDRWRSTSIVRVVVVVVVVVVVDRPVVTERGVPWDAVVRREEVVDRRPSRLVSSRLVSSRLVVRARGRCGEDVVRGVRDDDGGRDAMRAEDDDDDDDAARIVGR